MLQCKGNKIQDEPFYKSFATERKTINKTKKAPCSGQL